MIAHTEPSGKNLCISLLGGTGKVPFNLLGYLLEWDRELYRCFQRKHFEESYLTDGLAINLHDGAHPSPGEISVFQREHLSG